MSLETRDSRRHDFFVVDNAIIAEHGKELGPYGIAVYCALALHASTEGEAFPSQATIAKETGCSPRKVREMLAKIVDLGLATVEARTRGDGGTTSSIYTLIKVKTKSTPRHTVPTPPAQRAAPPRHTVPTNKTQKEQDPEKKGSVSAGARRVSRAKPASPPLPGATGHRDAHFEALAEICGLQTNRLTKGNRALLGKGASGLREDGATPDLIKACGETWYSEKFGWKERASVAPPSVAQAIEWVGQRLMTIQARRDRIEVASRVPRPYLLPGGRGLKPITSLMSRPEFKDAQPGDPSTYPAEYIAAAQEMGVRFG